MQGASRGERIGDSGHEESKPAKIEFCGGEALRRRAWLFRSVGSARERSQAEAEEAAARVPVRRAVCGPGAAAVCGSGWTAGHSGGCARSLWAAHGGRSGQELDRIEGHDALLAAVGIIAPAEADALAVEGGEAVVGDSHAMGVAAEVAQDMFGAAEGRLGVDVPSLVAELVDQLLEPRGSRRDAAGPPKLSRSLR